jgi:hypothetical protein
VASIGAGQAYLDGELLTQLVDQAPDGPDWLHVTTAEERSRLESDGLNLTIFTYPLSNATREVLVDALGTVVEHHPREIVWVQHVCPGECE